MTKEELIFYGKDYLHDLETACCKIEEKHKEFVRESIKALEKEPCEDCEDAISREAAQEAVENTIAKYIPVFIGRYERIPLEVAIAIRDLPPVKPVACIAEIKFSKEDIQKIANEKIKEITAELEERWIPCSERLPKESGFYLVSTSDCITIMEFIGGEWISQNIGSCNWYVKAWQPLPQPYKEEKQ